MTIINTFDEKFEIAVRGIGFTDLLNLQKWAQQSSRHWDFRSERNKAILGFDFYVTVTLRNATPTIEAIYNIILPAKTES